ncbi:Manganese/iron superoxide dismutase [Lipomyces japonicus]|uniref:mitochondrial 37S ribosomal protein mS42 n=1 Tax=Lipomyces japonicus TaxID=56871 RepID=UPI0034CE7B88
MSRSSSIVGRLISGRRAIFTNSSARPLFQTRGIHQKPVLTNESQLEKNGISGLYSDKQFKLAWVDYQNYLVKQLNKRVQDTAHENRTAFQTILATARHANQVPIFNFASLAHNNHFFFESLKNNGDNEKYTGPGALTIERINDSFTNINELKDHFKAVVEAISGNAFVWLIESPSLGLYIVPTYNAGTPYDFARQQSVDYNSPIEVNSIEGLKANQESLRSNPKYSPEWPLPVLAINVWEHAYLLDYGFDGKAEYFEKWWKSIDWTVVEKRLTPAHVSKLKKV